MGENRNCIFIGCMGVVSVGIAMVLELMGKATMSTSFFMVFIAFGMIVATKILMTSYVGSNQYRVINLVAMNNMIKLVILIFYFYFISI